MVWDVKLYSQNGAKRATGHISGFAKQIKASNPKHYIILDPQTQALQPYTNTAIMTVTSTRHDDFILKCAGT